MHGLCVVEYFLANVEPLQDPLYMVIDFFSEGANSATRLLCPLIACSQRLGADKPKFHCLQKTHHLEDASQSLGSIVQGTPNASKA